MGKRRNHGKEKSKCKLEKGKNSLNFLLGAFCIIISWQKLLWAITFAFVCLFVLKYLGTTEPISTRFARQVAFHTRMTPFTILAGGSGQDYGSRTKFWSNVIRWDNFFTGLFLMNQPLNTKSLMTPIYVRFQMYHWVWHWVTLAWRSFTLAKRCQIGPLLFIVVSDKFRK